MPSGRTDVATIKLRRGTASQWSSINPVLQAGEPGVETDTGKMKIGDGTTNYNSLNYVGTVSVGWGSINGTLSSQTDLQTALNGKQASLVSGTNIKTINSTSLLGSGDIALASSWGSISGTLSSQTDLQSALNAKEGTITAGTTAQYYRGDKSFQTLDKSAVGLGNVDNTSDASKPVSTATQTALNAKQGTLTLTTTGSSGAATLVGATLNIPQYPGTVTSIGLSTSTTGVTVGSSPVTSSGTITVNIATASASAAGLLSSTDWTTFNNKQATLSLTTTGSSGAATFTSGTLNIPTYTLAGLGGVSSNMYTADGTLTSARTLTSGGYNLTFTGSNTASGAIARGINLTHTLVAAANSDVLVGLDINPTFTNGAYTGVSNLGLRVGGANGLNYDVANQRLGIGTNAPTSSVDIWAANSTMKLTDTAVSNRYLQLQSTGGNGIISHSNGNLTLNAGTVYTPRIILDITSGFIFQRNGPIELMRIWPSTGNLTLQYGGTYTDAGYKLDVNGTVRVQDNFTISDAKNIILGTTTGSKIGTATSQKIGFWNATPIVQPTTAVTAATRVSNSGNTVTDADTFDGYTLPQIVKALRNAGLLA